VTSALQDRARLHCVGDSFPVFPLLVALGFVRSDESRMLVSCPILVVGRAPLQNSSLVSLALSGCARLHCVGDALPVSPLLVALGFARGDESRMLVSRPMEQCERDPFPFLSLFEPQCVTSALQDRARLHCVGDSFPVFPLPVALRFVRGDKSRTFVSCPTIGFGRGQSVACLSGILSFHRRSLHFACEGLDWTLQYLRQCR